MSWTFLLFLPIQAVLASMEQVGTPRGQTHVCTDASVGTEAVP